MRLHQRVRRGKLQGEQQRLAFPRRGRPTKFRTLERCGQMRLNLSEGRSRRDSGTSVRIGSGDSHLRQIAASDAVSASPTNVMHRNPVEKAVEDFDSALQMTFPVRPMTEDELDAEFKRLFPIDDRVRI